MSEDHMGASSTAGSAPDNRPSLAIVGAGGSVGEQLCRALAPRYRVTAITHLGMRAEAGDTHLDIAWVYCDLFSLVQVQRALQGTRFAIFLAHSGLPNSRLHQAECADMDLLMADNFARGAQSAGLEHVICLRSILPVPDLQDTIHQQHQQVADSIACYATPITVLRSGLVVEPTSAMVRSIVHQVKRSRYVPLPAWCRHRTQPIAMRDLARAFSLCLQHPLQFTGHYDIGGPELLDWKQFMEQVTEIVNPKSRLVSLKRLSPTAYIWWLRRARPQVHPQALELFVHNMRFDLPVADNPLQRALQPDLSPALSDLVTEHTGGDVRHSIRSRRKMLAHHGELLTEASTVRSIQRIRLPDGYSVTWLSRRYFSWLSAYLHPLIECVEASENSVCIRLRGVGLCLLRLELRAERCNERRLLYSIVGGLLASRKRNLRGRMEFRQIDDSREAIIAIHDFAPALPWNFYLATQATVHYRVMRSFQRYIESRHKK